MIKSINMMNVASYKKKSELITDKRINLIYGLNGTGKSTISNFLYNPHDIIFKDCSIDYNGDEEILVYNQSFINDNFYEDSFKGIFTLSKENKSAKEKIDKYTKELEEFNNEKSKILLEIENVTSYINQLNERYQNIIWNIKKNYDGKKYLDYCFDKIKKDKKTFFDYVLSIENNIPSINIDAIETNIKELNNERELLQNLLEFDVEAKEIENNQLFKKAIVGNKNSSLSEVIDKLNISDWVKQGINYINVGNESIEKCPFCQKDTIDIRFKTELKNLFDNTYEKNIKELTFLYNKYELIYNNIPILNLNDLPINKDIITNLSNKIEKYKNLVRNNLVSIREKCNMPSLIISLNSTEKIVEEINILIRQVNLEINTFNEKLNNKKASLQKLKNDFWHEIKRINKSTIDEYLKELNESEQKLNGSKEKIKDIEDKIISKKEMIVLEQKNTINIDEAIGKINNMLIEIGITDFYITKSLDKMYKIVRNNNDNNIFATLSEGEKMIISFLYFIELCNGTTDSTSNFKDKIIVIDDPINSMSHIYVFNVGRFIKKMIYENVKYKQIYIFTHSLYFFYELTFNDKEDRDKEQKLFRIIKNINGSDIVSMHYEEIQNDYHSYWSIIKDKDSHPALIANCMRNVIEYFFGFIEDTSLNNVFQRKELSDNRFQAFVRYINRESHSFGQNIFDFKEFNYNDFLEGFRLVFKLTNYEEHFNKMMK